MFTNRRRWHLLVLITVVDDIVNHRTIWCNRGFDPGICTMGIHMGLATRRWQVSDSWLPNLPFDAFLVVIFKHQILKTFITYNIMMIVCCVWPFNLCLRTVLFIHCITKWHQIQSVINYALTNVLGYKVVKPNHGYYCNLVFHY